MSGRILFVAHAVTRPNDIRLTQKLITFNFYLNYQNVIQLTDNEDTKNYQVEVVL